MAARRALPEEATESLSGTETIRKTVDSRIGGLQRGYRADHPGAVSAIARIRRGAGRPAGVIPDLWG
ncbi:hypothetical protein NKH18_25050 [Streptomyces sp. M10(2022)]